MNFKPGDKIDLSKFERYKKRETLNYNLIREKAIERLESTEDENLKYLNLVFEKAGAPDMILDHDGAINGEIFKKSHGGIIEDEDVDLDHKVVQIKNEKAFHKNEQADGHLAEKISAILLNKAFRGSEYVIVNSNPHDDHENGVDQVIMNIETGETICALDDFVSNDSLIKKDSTKENRFAKKVDRIMNKKRYGARLKYGVLFRGGKFERLAHIKGLPLAVLRVERDLFYKSMRDMDFSIKSDQCDSEKKLLSYMVDSLDDQLSTLTENVNVSYDSVYRLVDFLKNAI